MPATDAVRDNGSMSDLTVRPATADDRDLLIEVLVLAFWWDGTERVPRDEIVAKHVPVYVDNWGRAGDIGVVVESEGVPAGAAWARFYGPEDKTYGHYAPHVPEIVAVGVLPDQRGKRAGSAAVDALLAALVEAGHTQASLSCEFGNDVARRLYESRGFIDAFPIDDAWTMVSQLGRQ